MTNSNSAIPNSADHAATLDEISLEAALAEITQLTDQLEGNSLSLDESLAKFERGVRLIKHCQKILATAEQKVQILVQANNPNESSHLQTYAELKPKEAQ